MDRPKSGLSKRPLSKAHQLPGDFIALGKQGQSRPGLESASAPQPLGRKVPPSLSDRKREAATPPLTGLGAKKPKLVGQTFTPLGRPSELERRASPAIPLLQFEEFAVDVEAACFMQEVLDAEEADRSAHLESLLCGAIKHLRYNRSKPDSAFFLALMFLAKTRGTVFSTDVIIEGFSSLLKRDLSLNFKAKGNPLVPVLVCNVMLAAFAEEENWPDEFVKVYIDDCLGERIWVDRRDCRAFVENIHTAFNTKIPPAVLTSSDPAKSGEHSGSSSPSLNMFEDEDKSNDEEYKPLIQALESSEAAMIFPRYPNQLNNIETFVVDLIREQLNRRQAMEASSRNLLRLMTITCGYGEVRSLVAQKLEMWLQNPKLTKPAQDLLMSVCMNCNLGHIADKDIVIQLIKIRLKSKPMLSHYLLCIRELISQHGDNLRLIMNHTIYNELSTSRNPNNMSLLGVMFQHSPENAAKVLAEIFQDLLVNKDDYIRALRALLREIVRAVRFDMRFSAFCLALMQNRDESKYTEMETQTKEKYILGIADLVTLSILLGISPSLREMSAQRGERKEMELLHQYQNQVAIIQRDAIWWLHTSVSKHTDLKPHDYKHCLHKVLFMESAEHYYNKDNWPPEGERGLMLRLASEAPVLEDTLMRVLVIGLATGCPLNPADAIEVADTLVRRAAMLTTDCYAALLVERVQLVDVLFNLCTYNYPENISLPKGYQPPTLSISSLYWKAWLMMLIISAFNPSTFGVAAWESYPTLKCLIEMIITNNFKFPPPTMAADEKTSEEIRAREKQMVHLERQQILEFESHLAAATSKVTITEQTSLLLSTLSGMDPRGIARKPPSAALEQVKILAQSLKIRYMLCKSRKPDFLLDIIQSQGTSQAMPWLTDLVDSSEGSLDVLPVQCLCEFLLHVTDDASENIAALRDEEDEAEKLIREQKQKKQEKLLSRLQVKVHGTQSDTKTSIEVLDYFLKRLSSQQASARSQAVKGLSLVISKPRLSKQRSDDSDDEEEPMEEEPPADNQIALLLPKQKWILEQFELLPLFQEVKVQTVAALREACQVETEPSLVSGYIIFLSQHAKDLELQELDDLMLYVAQLIVERSTLLNVLLCQEVSQRSDRADLTLQSLISLCNTYLQRAMQPDKEAYAWSNTRDQILLEWQSGQSATLHILVVHAMIILLTFGPAHVADSYEKLLDTWFPLSGHTPTAYLLDTSEEALLLPDWLKLRMIRCPVTRVVNAALQDLDTSQLVLFVQSFGIPIVSMSQLLHCLDAAVATDADTLEQRVVDKVYMAQLIEIQHMRGATGGEKFSSFLQEGIEKPQQVEEEKTCEMPLKKPSIWTTATRADTEAVIPQTLDGMVTFIKNVYSSSDLSIKGHHQTALLKGVVKNDEMHKLVLEAFHTCVTSKDGATFISSVQKSSSQAAALLRVIFNKKTIDSVKATSLVLRLEEVSLGENSALTPIIELWWLKKKQAPGSAMSSLKDIINKWSASKHGQPSLEELIDFASKQDISLDAAIKRSMLESVQASGPNAAAMLASQWMLNAQNSPLNMSAASLLIDWLTLLDPEIIKACPEIQQKLLFAKAVTPTADSASIATPSSSSLSGGNRSSGTAVTPEQKSSQPYLLALLTQQGSWETLHHCITQLLKQDGIDRFDATATLDFLWACYHIPRIWQGRDKKLPKNYTPEDVLGLTDSQLICVVEYIIKEMREHENDTTQSKNQDSSPSVLSSRLELIKFCICGNEEQLRTVVWHIQNKIKANKDDGATLYQKLLLELYLQYPCLMSWLDDTRVLVDKYTTQHGLAQLDCISHRLIVALGHAAHGKVSENRMYDASLACRKLASHHPTLFIRQLPLLGAVLKGKTQFSFGEMRHRNYLMLFTYALGLLELLQPEMFLKDTPALEDIIDVYFGLIQIHGEQRQLASVIVKFVELLHQFSMHSSQRASNLLLKHIDVLNKIAAKYPDLAKLKSLLAGQTLLRTDNADKHEILSGESSTSSLHNRPTSPWTVSQLAPFHQRLQQNNSIDGILEVLQDLDETSKRKVSILEHFMGDLKQLMCSSNERCRNLAFTLIMRHGKQDPSVSVEFVGSFLHCLNSQNPDVVLTALKNLSEFTILCQDHSSMLLQHAFTVGICSALNATKYITDAIQLLNMDSAI